MTTREDMIRKVHLIRQKRAKLLGTKQSGEIQAIDHLLKKIYQKWEIDPQEVMEWEISEEPVEVTYTFGLASDRMLLEKVIYHVLQVKTFKYRGVVKTTRKKDGTLSTRKLPRWILTFTPEQHEDIRRVWTHYKKELKAHLELQTLAFIHSNKIYGPPSDNPDHESSMDVEELMSLLKAMAGVTPSPPPIIDRKRLLNEKTN